jgi:hypothetical protein
MKTFTIILLAGLAFVAGSPAFAGRDGTQTMQQQLAQAKKAQAGLAGATGAPGKVGPQGQPATPRRDPSAHP